MQYKDWDGNLLPDPAPRIHNVHIGDVIKIKENERESGEMGKTIQGIRNYRNLSKNSINQG